MASRWINLLLGVALLQGALTFSPIPEMELEDEWATFNQRLDDPNFRLPTALRPRHYEVTLTPYFDIVPTPNIQPFSFLGEVNIYFSTTVDYHDEVVLHCNDLTLNTVSVTYRTGETTTIMHVHPPSQVFVCDPVTDLLRIRTYSMRLPQEYTLRITFTGNIQPNMRGFYRSWYRDSTGLRWMGTTQFQPGHARQAFPCWDEPGFKATFDISINRDSTFSPTISNMPIATTSAVVDGRVTETFHTTPLTSTYLLAFIVSHYVVVSAGTNVNRPFNIYARNNIDNHGDWSLNVGERLLTRMEEYTQFPYYTMATNMNMKQAAIPDFSAGAMENWGLLTYREALILYDPLNSNHFYRQRVANIVSHEIAHMWFGNLVTCAWWDNLWLNEGFARFYQYFLTAMVEPDLGFETRFIVEQVHVSMISDSVDTAHALTDPTVSNPTSVSAHFSTITYARGAAVIRMTQHLLGDDTFVKALRNYLQARQYDVAEPHHLFTALDNAAAEDNALTAYNGITIDEYFRTWSEKAGHPLLTVVVNPQTGDMTVTQSRWERTTGVSNDGSLYHIPITWTRELSADFTNLKPVRIMTAQTEIIPRETTGLEWVLFNKQETGFYRVNYDNNNWILLTRALRSSQRTVIHEYNRAQIVDDLFAFARSSLLSYNRIFNILSFLEFEDQYAPWLAAITGFNWAIRRLAHNEDNRQKLNEMIIQLSTGVVTRLGFAEINNESYMDGLLRMYLMSFLCDVGHQGCNTAAVTNFQAWKNGGNVPANLRPWVYCAGLRAGDSTDFDYFWSRYLAEDLAGEQVVLIQAAGCTRDTASLGRFWEAITAGDDTIRPQDSSSAISSAITNNEENTMKSFAWVQANLERTRSTIGLTTPLNSIISRLLNEAQIAEVNTWLTANRELLGESVFNTGVSAIATSRANIAWYDQRASQFADYFETGYEELELDLEEEEEESDEVTTVAPVEESEEDPEEETDDTDSANIAVLSMVTLFVTLSINFLA